MKIKSVLRAAGAAVAIAVAAPAAAHDLGETVTPHFERAIPNIPGKSLVALVVDCAPGGASLPHTHAKSPFRSVRPSRIYIRQAYRHMAPNGGPTARDSSVQQPPEAEEKTPPNSLNDSSSA